MLSFLLRRLAQLIPVWIGVSLIIFILIHAAPGDPIMVLLGDRATPEQIAQLRTAYGLDKPLTEQYVIFIGRLLKGDLGTSIHHRIPVAQLIADRLPRTLVLIVTSAVIAFIVGIITGTLSALYRGTWIDYIASFIAFFGVAAPSFWIGIMMIMIFALHLGWFPVLGAGEQSLTEALAAAWSGNAGPLKDYVRSLVMPALTNSFWMMALVMRLTRTNFLEQMELDYVRTAFAKGLGSTAVYMRHVFRNALNPIITVTAVQFGTVLSGAVVTESVFAWPGMGLLLIDSVFQRDYPVVQSVVILTALMFAFVNIVVDIAYAVLDPRIRYG